MPALGMAQDTGVIVSWRKALGDRVDISDPLFDVETDKTTMEVEAAHEGYLTEIRADAGAEIPVGQTIAIIAASGEVPAGTGVDLVPDTPKEPVAPTAPNRTEPPAVRDRPAAPSTPSAAPTISASPKAKFEAHRRGIDLRRLVDQGLPQPFHVADLDRLMPETGTAGPSLQASLLTANFAWPAFDGFIVWAEEKTGRQDMRLHTLAAFAAAALRTEVRSDGADSLAVSVMSVEVGAAEIILRDPDLQGLGDVAESAEEAGDAKPDLTLIDLSGTRLVAYKPAIWPGHLTINITDDTEDKGLATLHFCEDDLSLLAAARFLDNFAARIAEPVVQLL